MMIFLTGCTKQLKEWMKTNFGLYNAEPHYSKITPKIICEKNLGSDIKNYNFFCLNGKPTFVSVIEGLGAGTDEALTYYYADGNKAEFYNSHYPTSKEPLPGNFYKMRDIAAEIASDFPFVKPIASPSASPSERPSFLPSAYPSSFPLKELFSNLKTIY